jgi:hypothetical protein
LFRYNPWTKCAYGCALTALAFSLARKVFFFLLMARGLTR